MFKEYGELPFDKWKKLIEVIVRGSFAKQSSTLEFSLFKIIVYCDSNNPEVTKQFRTQTLGNKLQWAKEMLSLHYPALHDSYKPYFTEFFEEDGLLSVRNNLLHCTFQFNETTQENGSFDVRIMSYNVGNKENIITNKTYSIEEMDTALSRFQDINVEFLGLWQKMVDDFNERARRC